MSRCCSRGAQPDWRPILTGYLGLILQGGTRARHRNVHLDHHPQPDHRGRGDFLGLPAAVGAELGQHL